MIDPVRTQQRQPAYIRLTNRVGHLLANAGFSTPGLDAERLIAAAMRRTGLQDFGDASFRDGLDRLTGELRARGKLSQVGRMAAYFNLIENLCVRLQLVDYRARHPAISREQIRQPLFVRLSDGRVQNSYELHMDNKTDTPVKLAVMMRGLAGAELDVGRLAEEFGGGGHSRAAAAGWGWGCFWSRWRCSSGPALRPSPICG